jgi:four helix bundle protein
MAMILNFEEIEAWIRARALTKAIYEITSIGKFARDYGLRDQIRRAAVSIMSNIAEGFERDGNKEFIQFLSDAKGSAGEVRSQLYVALDAKLITEREFEDLRIKAEEVAKIIGGFIRYLKASEFRGTKFQRITSK